MRTSGWPFAIQQTLQAKIRDDAIELNARFDALLRQPIIAAAATEKNRAQDDPYEDPNAVPKKPLTKIHDSKLSQAAHVHTVFVHSKFMIHCRGIEYTYPQGGPHLVFPDVQCAERGQLLLLGQSGSGKTTLLHLICGMLQPASGEVEINGQRLGSLSERERDAFRGRNFGLVFQKSHFVQSLSVLENLAIPSFLLGEAFVANEAMELLRRLGIEQKAHVKPRNLSVGEQQRVSIARALIHRPAIVLADEPTSALDDGSTEAVISLLEAQAAEAGATLVIVTHDQRLKDRYAHQVVLPPLQTPVP